MEAIENVEVFEYEHHGIPSLVAMPVNVREPEVLMCGHLDVITHPDVYSYRSYIEDGKIYGPGAGDMKGALAIMLEILRDFHTKHPGVSLGLAVTADEETGGKAGIGYLFGNTNLRCGAALIPDGGSLNEITIEEKGILHIKIRCQGRAAHAARPWLGDNPIEKLMDRLSNLQKYFSSFKRDEDHWFPTCSITIIGTENQTINRVPSNCEAVCDIRFPSPFTIQEIMDKTREALGADVEIEVVISAEPTHLSPDPLYQQVTEEITGEPAALVREHGGSDARFIYAGGVPIMMSRPIVGNLHAENEWIDIQSMIKYYRICEKYLTIKLLKKSKS
ncbi:M20 family metallopeptidase [PVC group bacterium]|nr:M20 family metallopeptidase [PVC group bacterium]